MLKIYSLKERFDKVVISAFIAVHCSTQFLSRLALLLIGTLLISTGGVNYVESQRDPQPAQAGDPEGVCCVAFPEPVFIVLPPEPVFLVLPPEPVSAVLAPEAAVGVLPEQAQTDPGQIAPLPDQEPEDLVADYDDRLPRFAAGNLLRFIEGSFGALVMIGAGLGAIIAGAFGAYKAALSLLFVAVGAFILRALVSLFFGTEYPAYSEGGMEFVGGL